MTENGKLIKDENEAIEALKLINTSRVHPFYSWEEMSEVRDIAIKALEEVQEYRKLGTVEEVREAVEKTKAKKCVEDTCPDHTHYKCPTCGKIQKTKYNDNTTYGCILNNCSNCGQRLESVE